MKQNLTNNTERYLIFMDINMPIMDGFEATQIIRNTQRELDFKQKVIIIIVSAFLENNEKEKAISSGADLFMSKPISIRELIANL